MEKKVVEGKNLTDKVGFETLDSIADANNFNEWMYQTIARQTKGNILEIGSGIGNISKLLLRDEFKLTVSDMRKEYCEILTSNFKDFNSFQGVCQLDIVDPNFDSKHNEILGTFDTVFALNIIEHVQDDEYAISNCKKLLKPGGKLIILVPAFQYLYNSFDVELGHFKRYTINSLRSIFVSNDIEVCKRQYFNFIGILGWWFSGNVLKKKIIPSGQMKLYNSLVWAFKIIDFFTNRIVGLSVIVSGKR